MHHPTDRITHTTAFVTQGCSLRANLFLCAYELGIWTNQVRSKEIIVVKTYPPPLHSLFEKIHSGESRNVI